MGCLRFNFNNEVKAPVNAVIKNERQKIVMFMIFQA